MLQPTKVFSFAALLMLISFGCKLSHTNPQKEPNKELAALFDRYYEERLELFPLEATSIGDPRYNNLLPADFTDSYRQKLRAFYDRYRVFVSKYDRENLGAQDQISYDIFKREMEINLEGLSFKDNLVPFNQFYALPLSMGQLGSGTGNQPFKTVKDYEDWLMRVALFSAWSDSAIIYFKRGVRENVVLPAALVKKMIPQLDEISTSTSLFLAPVQKFPEGINAADRQRLTTLYQQAVAGQLMPAYKRLAAYLKNEYLQSARATSGAGDLPDGSKFYSYLVRQQTTTDQSPEEIYQTGLREVARIRRLMDSVKTSVNYPGDLPAFFELMKSDKLFTPYKTPAQVLAAFDSIHRTMQPNLNKMFTLVPKTPFEIRQTEAFRAASASAEYNQGSPDGTRPGIFYVPILDATTFNTTSGMESLFLHEAIPGHHYQISLQQEDSTLPKFRRFGGNNAYIEGWALYCESLGKELGLYTDPYQYMGALGDEMHRAIRLVVDVAIHSKGMTREEAIQYMMANEAISEQGATAEIERYMAIPAQALGYKVGALKIRELRSKYEASLGEKFRLPDFHSQVLKDGAMPLQVLEAKLNTWADKMK
ncbi:DUF885 domain-containing protein [Segetibacter sp. 3557_3]|nr:DUF885 domain-containing protein [Segetibacter sp. 3557_3]